MPTQVHHEACSGLWRSEDMVRLNLILQREALHDTVVEVGMLGKAQFMDMNGATTAFARPFTGEIRRCEDLQRKLRRIEEDLRKDPSLTALYSDYDMCSGVEEMRHHLGSGDINAIEDRVESIVTELDAMAASLEGLQREISYNVELRLLYDYLHGAMQTSSGVDGGGGGNLLGPNSTWSEVTRTASGEGLAAIRLESLSQLSSILGVVSTTQSETLYRLCYRITRGNAIVMLQETEDPTPASFNAKRNATGGVTRDPVEASAKVLFVVLCSSSVMASRLRKLISGLSATVYSLDEVTQRGGALATGVSPAQGKEKQHPTGRSDGDPLGADVAGGSGASPEELQLAMDGVSRRKKNLLSQWYPEHRLYKCFLGVEKAVLTTMNLCSFSGTTCTASVWIPRKHQEPLARALEDAVSSSGGEVQSIITPDPSQKNPPTYFETNFFTETFQSIVDSYGMAHYKEVNPGVFTIITFPYLFGIMYGDIGHGALLLVISLYLISKSNVWKPHQLNEIVAMLFGGRYLMMMMSLFAIYMGFLYNDFCGLSINMGRSGYTWGSMEGQHDIMYPEIPNGKPSVKPPHVYLFGLDVAWAETENKLEFYNSIKMKCAVIVGVVQMVAGLFLSLDNYIRKGDWFRVGFLFIPEFVFIMCTFGYMSILIIIKWCLPWENTNNAPSLLEVMTNFFLSPGSVAQPMFEIQSTLQLILLLLAVAMVPLMLLGMPIVEYQQYKAWKKRHTLLFADLDDQNFGADEEFGGAITPPASMSRRANRGEHSAAVQVNEPASSARRNANNESTSHRLGASADLASELASQPGDLFGPDGADIDVGARQDEHDEEFENFDMAEMVIHYVIHTIEYVLSSVSNTASYLRLWALSLAHAQLSEVFFTFAIAKLLGLDTSGIAVGIGAFLWLAVTIGVLVGMEALSAFLHALRLHWVEFQNKFYAGDGRPLEPLNLTALNA